MPVKRMMVCMCPNKTKYQMDTMFSFFLIFAFVVLATHVFACFWVSLAQMPTPEEYDTVIVAKDTWLYS